MEANSPGGMSTERGRWGVTATDTAATSLGLHRERLPHSRRVHLPRHDIAESRQPRPARAHAVAQSRRLALDDLEHAPRDLFRRNAARQGPAKLREHALAGDVVRREFPLGLRRSLTNRGVYE